LCGDAPVVQVYVCTPKAIYICDGSTEETEELTEKLVDRGLLVPLPKMENCYACRTDPADVARVESKTFIVTDEKVGFDCDVFNTAAVINISAKKAILVSPRVEFILGSSQGCGCNSSTLGLKFLHEPLISQMTKLRN
jgi:Phosphoenolpyruvate carboxykinase N-terminal domain